MTDEMRGRATLTSCAPIFPVADVARAIAHYQRLGFEVQPYEDGQEYAFATRDGVEIHLSRLESYDPKVGAACVFVRVDDADALADEWDKPGIGGRTGRPEDTPYRIREGSHIDPDNNLIRFGSYIK